MSAITTKDKQPRGVYPAHREVINRCDGERLPKVRGTCGLSVTTFFHQVLNYYYLTVYIMFKPKMSLWDLP